ncbi:Negative regulator of mitosis [Vanrija pseudolonga]|uniref:Negative regulator of mitosis n=1 Tax=Vanrija pseudolonga TaxID=143232 RepID=A0AAF1BSR7_9TREE|nr:Negative regulator of mitosis [Vanrija pseudolonga]
MLQATVLGDGVSPGHVLYARAGSSSTSGTHGPSQEASGSSSSSSSRAPIHQTFAPLSLEEGSVSNATDEALTWSGRSVTWSRGVEIFRRFTYEHQSEKVAYAAFVWFRPPGDEGAAAPSTPKAPDASSTFGPFHTSQHAQWGAKSAELRPSATGLQRAVVVFLASYAFVYFASGQDTKIALPWPVERCWALPDGGALVQRALERREQKRLAETKGRKPRRSSFADRTGVSVLDDLVDREDAKAPKLPRLFTFTDIFGEFKWVAEAEIGGGFGDEEPSLAANASTTKIPMTQSIIYVAPAPYPLLVAYDHEEGQFLFYRRARIPLPETNDMPPTSSVKSMRPEELLRATELPPPPSSRRGGRASLSRSTLGVPTDRRVSGFGGAGVPTDRRVSSLGGADLLDRSRRKASRASMANEIEADDDPFAGPAAAAFGSSRRVTRVSSFGTETKSQRLSMAGKRRDDARDYPRLSLHVMAEDLGETTMIMGLDKEQLELRSEIVVERVYSWRPPGDVDLDAARVFLSENRSPQSAHLNLVLTFTNLPTTLFTFGVEEVSQPSPAFVFNAFRGVHCVAAVPVLATRSNVLDTLLLAEDGSLNLFSASSHQMAVQIPRVLTADGRDEVAHKLAASLSMVLDGDGEVVSSERRVVDLLDASGSKVTVVYSDGDRLRVSLDFEPAQGVACRCLEALSYALSQNEFAQLSEAFLAELQQQMAPQRSEVETQWRTLSNVLYTMCGLTPSPEHDTRVELLSGWSTQSDPVLRRLAQRIKMVERTPASTTADTVRPHSLTPNVLLALHLVAQDSRLSSATASWLTHLAPVLLRLSAAIGREDWVDYWRRLMPGALAGTPLAYPSRPVDHPLLDQFHEPPDILLYLSRLLMWPTRPFPSPQSCFPNASPLGSPDPCKQTRLVATIYSTLTHSPESRRGGTLVPIEKRAITAVKIMVDNGVDTAWLADLPFGVAMPLQEIVRVAQVNPSKDVSPQVFEFVDRKDLASIYTADKVSTTDLPMGPESGPKKPPTIGEIVASVTGETSKHAHFAALPHVRFGVDKRVEEVERIMQTTHQRTIAVEDPKGASEQDIMQYHQSVVNTIANRTLAITVGQGMFHYSSRSATITDPWNIPLIELAVKVVPGNNVIKAQIPEGADWPCFHNGVSAALSISSDSKGIDASWIAFNRPDTPSADHAGFLLGLGLTGRLRTMNAIGVFPYLELRHDMTSVGLLLGLGASFAGSCDPQVTRMVSLHAAALLPLGSMELNESPVVQSTALVSLGLIYVGSKNLHMAEVVLGEIARSEMPRVDGFTESREAYSFSASMAFGLIMLGRGGSSSSETERGLLAQLTPCIHGDAPRVHGGKNKRTASHIDATVTSPGATLALGLMYLKTGRQDIADLLEIPQTALALESVRPDQLLIRTYARALILWDDVKPQMEWVDAQLPAFIQSLHHGHKRTSGMELNTELAYLNIIAGACLGLGIRFASTANEAAHVIILTFFGVLGKAAAGQSMTYEGRIRRNTARQALNILTLALATLMSGTGELNVMRRLRVSHGQEGAGVTYGSHMAMHMALGLLFLGRGYFTLGNSNLAIAALSISFFPRFLASPMDIKAYPQAYRHLWALAVEPRCLIARDVDTRESIFMPIKIKVRGRAGEQNLISPTLVAPFDTIVSITVDSPRYWPVTYDLSNPRDRDSLVRSRTIWVKRKSGFLDYNFDPRGYRSMFVRAGTMAGFDMQYDLVSPAAPIQLASTEIVELISLHTGDSVIVGMVKRFAGSAWLESFVRYVLFECVSVDKPSMLGVYLSMALALGSSDELKLERLAQVAFLLRFYRPTVFEREYSTLGGEKRHPILRQTFLHALQLRLTARQGTQESQVAYLRGANPTPAEVAALAVYLAHNHVPARRLLQALSQLVPAAAAAGSSGTELEIKAREASDKYATAVLEQFDAEEDTLPADLGAWKLPSVRAALGAWASA